MPRTFSRVNVTIWQDEDWRDLPPAAQHLYLVLWTHPSLSYCGVVDWRPGKLGALAGGWTKDAVERAADCLEARLFLVIDQDTEECLIRSWAKHDGLLKEPRMAVSFANAYATVASRELQGVIVHEANRMHDTDPDLAGWAKPQVAAMLTKTAIDPRTRALPDDPFGPGSDPVSGAFGAGLALIDPGVKGSVKGSPTPSPTPSTYSTSIAPAPRKSADDAAFEAFWAAYPKRKDKGHARTAWVKAVRKADPDTITAAAQRFTDDPNRDPAYTPLAATWLNGERWEDGPCEAKSLNNGRPTTDDRVRAGLSLAQQIRAERGQQTFPQIGA